MTNTLQKEGKGTPAVTVAAYDKLVDFQNVKNSAIKSVCKITTAKKTQGTTALYRVLDQNNQEHFLMMTCNHVLPTTSLQEIFQAILEFEGIQEMRSIQLKLEDVIFVWTAELLDATVIELSPEVASIYSSNGAKFLEIDIAELNVEFTILQYPDGIFSISLGDIERIIDNYVCYRSGTSFGSSGSPLLTRDCKAIAMHHASNPGAADNQPDVHRWASALSYVVKAYLEEISRSGQVARNPKENCDKSTCFQYCILYCTV